jgi:hypothetical protein
LAALIRTTTAATKEQLPWLKCARFGDRRTAAGSLRHNANVLVITGLEGDYDGERISVADVVRIITEAALCAIVYTSPSHTEDAPRWRVLCPLSVEHPPEMRDRFLGRLNGVLGGILSNESWTLSQSFYFGSVKRNPSHRVVVIEGDFIDLRADLDAGAFRPALREAQTKHRVARSACPAAPRSDSLIEKIRARLDLSEVLTSHGYARRGHDYRHANSHSGSFGLNIATFRGIERAYSHNGGDPLHPGNLPAWTAGVTAIDVVDVVAILDYGGDRTRALRELAVRFGLTGETTRLDRAGALSRDCVPLPGTAGAVYLQAGALPHLVAVPDLRFHPLCPHPTGMRLPALVAAVRGPDGALTGILRTFLRLDGSGLADVVPQRAALGLIHGGAIRLGSLEEALSAGELVIDVDFEEAASLALLMDPERPAWAAVTDANLGHGLVLPTDLRGVLIADHGGNGVTAAWHRLKREGRAVRTATPDDGAAGFNEILRGGCHE